VTPHTELNNGTHTWWVRAMSAYGTAPWSAAGSFVVSASTPGVPTLLWPVAGANGAIRPTYRWNQVTAATWYQLWVDEMGAPPLIQTWYFSGDVCSGSVCAITPNVPLRPGASYRWFVRASSSSRGVGLWSSGTTFSVATAAPPAATLVSPAGNGVAALPTYTWNRVPGASWYYLWVTQAGSGPVVQRWYRAEEICGVSTCSAALPTSLAGGHSFLWWIQTYNDFGYGPWSAPASFAR
jgi:hypothetical protein